jgi:hypothetical protein
MQKKATRNKDFRTVWTSTGTQFSHIAMQKSKPLNELFQIPSKALRDLAVRLEARVLLLGEVRRLLPPKLAAEVCSAGLEQGRLTLGVTSAVWAHRLRYTTGILRKELADSMKTTILNVRIQIVPGTAVNASKASPGT